jgi:hypothetical protein
MRIPGSRAAKRIVLESLGWILVAGGIVALVLPGPGLLGIVAGLILLSQQYDWAARRLEPVKKRALETAADGVATVPRILASCLGALILVGLGVLWTVQPDVPGWWPIGDRWWLLGGWGAGVSLLISGVVAFVLIGYSIKNFRHPRPAARPRPS